MEFTFYCPHCSQKYIADSEQAGSELNCTTCHNPLVVPSNLEEFIPSTKRKDNPPKKPKLLRILFGILFISIAVSFLILNNNDALYIKINEIYNNSFKHLNILLNEHVETTLIDLFTNADRMSMAHSVESRLPFMDYRLVEFLSKLPTNYKIHNGWTKFISRIAFENKLTDKIIWRKDKYGFESPNKKWLTLHDNKIKLLKSNFKQTTFIITTRQKVFDITVSRTSALFSNVSWDTLYTMYEG